MFFKLNLVLPVVCLAGICVSVHVKHEFFRFSPYSNRFLGYHRLRFWLNAKNLPLTVRKLSIPEGLCLRFRSKTKIQKVIFTLNQYKGTRDFAEAKRSRT